MAIEEEEEKEEEEKEEEESTKDKKEEEEEEEEEEEFLKENGDSKITIIESSELQEYKSVYEQALAAHTRLYKSINKASTRLLQLRRTRRFLFKLAYVFIFIGFSIVLYEVGSKNYKEDNYQPLNIDVLTLGLGCFGIGGFLACSTLENRTTTKILDSDIQEADKVLRNLDVELFN